MNKLTFAAIGLSFTTAVLADNALPLHPQTGLVNAEGHTMVMAHCTGCHSAKLISQNRMDKSTWLATIRWMQKTQNLWPLGEAEPIILEYLATYYAPTDTGRRANLPPHLMPPAPTAKK